jgi:hypothetical protein
MVTMEPLGKFGVWNMLVIRTEREMELSARLSMKTVCGSRGQELLV